jgi:hypothetical protein
MPAKGADSSNRSKDKAMAGPALPRWKLSLDSLSQAEKAVETAVQTLLGRVAHWAHAHPRRLAAGTVTVLAVFAGTAFGIAPMAPDASALPKRLVIENFTPENLDAQLDALAAQHLILARSDVTRANETATTLTKRLGVSDAELNAFLQTDVTSRKLWQGRAGKMVSATTDDNGKLIELVARYPAERDDQFSTHFSRLAITRGERGFTSKVETLPLGTTTRLATGTVRTSLFAATDDANVPDPIATQMAEMFSTDIDFHRELRKGDTFSVVYEALTADGEPVPWNQGAGSPCGSPTPAARARTSTSTAAASTAPSWPARSPSRVSPPASRCASTRS